MRQTDRHDGARRTIRRAGNKMGGLGRALPTLALMMLGLGALAVPCVTPGDPIGCEIDTPLDGQAWMLAAAAASMAAPLLARRRRAPGPA